MTGFFIFLAVVYGADAYLFSKGFDCLFFKYKTDLELDLRERIISERGMGKKYAEQ